MNYIIGIITFASLPVISLGFVVHGITTQNIEMIASALGALASWGAVIGFFFGLFFLDYFSKHLDTQANKECKCKDL